MDEERVEDAQQDVAMVLGLGFRSRGSCRVAGQTARRFQLVTMPSNSSSLPSRRITIYHGCEHCRRVIISFPGTCAQKELEGTLDGRPPRTNTLCISAKNSTEKQKSMTKEVVDIGVGIRPTTLGNEGRA